MSYNQAVLFLLKAEQLPRNHAEIRQPITAQVNRALEMTAYISPESPDLEALAYLREALAILPLKPAIATYSQQERATLPPERYEEHDQFFGAARVSGNPMQILIHSMLKAYCLLLEDATTTEITLDAHEWAILRAAYDLMLCYIRKTVFGTRRWPKLFLTTSAVAKHDIDPLRRWKTGHQVFFTFIQGLIIALNCFRHSIDCDDLQDASAALDLATCLMWGSASALRFAGDFPPDDYEHIVRPAMMPPNLKLGFSGLQARDHRYLLKIMREMKPVFLNLDGYLQGQYHRFTQAIEAAYEAHKFVCGQFKGHEEPSLRMSSDAKMSAVDVLELLKHSRLRIVSP